MPAKPDDKKIPLICRCVCPYCDVELIISDSPFCEVCKTSFGRCASCGAVIVEKDSVKCTRCGKSLK